MIVTLRPLVWVLAFGAAGCLGADATATQDFKCPSKAAFVGQLGDAGPPVESVSSFMERRCGTLDCHGSTFRPMRLYGHFGLRDPVEKNVAGGKATTTVELDANYASVCGLEPEKMTQAVDDIGASADKLLVIQKARGTEGHKGGAVVKQGSMGDECLLSWLRGDKPDAVAQACQKAIGEL